MTKKEKATSRYILRELRRHKMVSWVLIRRSGIEKGNIIFHLQVDTDGILATHLEASRHFSASGMVLREEITFYSNRPCAELRENLNAKLFNAFLDYEGNLINALEERLEIPDGERMGSGG